MLVVQDGQLQGRVPSPLLGGYLCLHLLSLLGQESLAAYQERESPIDR